MLNMSWLVDRVENGSARILGGSVREQAGRWWISFQIEVDRDDINKRHQADPGAPACGIDLGLKTFAVIKNTDGTTSTIEAPKPLRAAQRALKRANRKLAKSGRIPRTGPRHAGVSASFTFGSLTGGGISCTRPAPG